MRAARSERAAGRRLAFSHAQSRLRGPMVPIITMPRLMGVGGGALAELPGQLQRLGLTKPLLVTDPFLVRSGHLDRATAILDQAGIPWRVVSDTAPGPTPAVVEAGTPWLAEDGYDSLVAIGGGSSIDTA